MRENMDEARELGRKFLAHRLSELDDNDSWVAAEWLGDEDPNYQAIPEDDDGTGPGFTAFWEGYNESRPIVQERQPLHQDNRPKMVQALARKWETCTRTAR